MALEVVQLLDRVLEEAPLAHDALGVQRPALAEVGRRVDLAHVATGWPCASPGASGGPGTPRGPRWWGSTRTSCSTGAPGSPPRWRRRARTGRRSGPSSGPRTRGGAMYDATPRIGPLEHRRRHDGARSPVGQGDQAGLDEERARPRRPLGVGLEHRLLGRRVSACRPRAGPRRSRALPVASGRAPTSRRRAGRTPPGRARAARARRRRGPRAPGGSASSAPRPAATSRVPRSAEALEVGDPSLEVRRPRPRRRRAAARDAGRPRRPASTRSRT